MSAAAIVLPIIWATAQQQKPQPAPNRRQPQKVATPKPVKSSLAFYRKYTEALLRRYAHMSLELARVPSLLGKEMFRGKVTNYVVRGFDDVVIFVHDVEKSLTRLDPQHAQLIERITIQEYTLEETVELTGLPLWSVNRQYGNALDAMTAIFLERKLLQPLICCQELENSKSAVSH